MEQFVSPGKLHIPPFPSVVGLKQQMGKASRHFLSGTRKLKMDFKVASPRKGAAKPSKAARRSGQQQLDGFTRKVNNPVSRQRSAQQIADETAEFDNSHWGDTDDEYIDDNESAVGDHHDPIEVDETDVEEDVPLATRAAAKRRRVEPGPSTARKEISTAGTAGKRRTVEMSRQAPWVGTRPKALGTVEEDDVLEISSTRESAESPVTRCLNEIKAFVAKVSPYCARPNACTCLLTLSGCCSLCSGPTWVGSG